MAESMEFVAGYEVVCNGWSAGINSTIFYACRICGACVAESASGMYEYNRAFHTEWHRRRLEEEGA